MSLLTINSLTVKYGDFTALDIAEPITLSAGDRIGIIGNNGAGKSTLVKALCGLANYSGEVQTALKASDMAVHLQENSYVKRIPCKVILEAVLNTNIADNAKLRDMIAFFDFEDCLKKRFAQLSGGQKQKLTIIMILMQDKPLTFFDEVTSGLDFESRQKLVPKVVEYYAGRDTTVCIVSHYYDELEKFCNKLLILDRGKVAAYGDVDTLFKKYCANVIYIIENTPANAALTKGIKRIAAPAPSIAFPCNSKEDEDKLAALFVANNVNFKRTDKDLEFLFVNAVAQFNNGGTR